MRAVRATVSVALGERYGVTRLAVLDDSAISRRDLRGKSSCRSLREGRPRIYIEARLPHVAIEIDSAAVFRLMKGPAQWGEGRGVVMVRAATASELR